MRWKRERTGGSIYPELVILKVILLLFRYLRVRSDTLLRRQDMLEKASPLAQTQTESQEHQRLLFPLPVEPLTRILHSPALPRKRILCNELK